MTQGKGLGDFKEEANWHHRSLRAQGSGKGQEPSLEGVESEWKTEQKQEQW